MKRCEETSKLLHSDPEKSNASFQREDEGFNSTSQLTMKQVILIIDLALVRFVENFSGCIPFPYFSRVMEDKGGTIFDAVLSIRLRMLSYVIFSAVLAKYYHKFGTKKLLFFGLVGSIFAQLAFGALNYADNLKVFIAGVSLSRVLYGVCRACVGVSVFAMACREYPNRIGIVLGPLQAGVFAGCLLGTAIGGILYDQFGMSVPVVGSAVVIIIFTAIQYPLLPSKFKNEEPFEEDDFSLQRFLSRPVVLSTLLVIASVFGVNSYVDVALTSYFRRKGISVTSAGIALGIWGGSYAGCSFVFEYASSRNSYFSRLAIGLGSIAFSGVMFALSFSQMLAVIYASCFFLGSFSAMCTITSFEQLAALARDHHRHKLNTSVYGKVSGIEHAAVGLGMFLFPVVVS